MEYWSEGLGEANMVLGLGPAVVNRGENAVILTGVCDAPAPWEYKVTVMFEDWAAVLQTATSKEAADFLVHSVPFVTILGMGWWMVKFVVMLAFFRGAKAVGMLAPAATAPSKTPLAESKKVS
ncbi:MAG: hypothetical protein PHQ05_01190 [Sterolibacterium sp.]|nr:hypothetical protein [Sterolibacterium sp.]